MIADMRDKLANTTSQHLDQAELKAAKAKATKFHQMHSELVAQLDQQGDKLARMNDQLASVRNAITTETKRHISTMQHYNQTVITLTKLYMSCYDITRDKSLEDEAKVRQTRDLLRKMHQQYTELRQEYRKRSEQGDMDPADPGLAQTDNNTSDS
jgi:hypothetical protein